MNFSKSKRLRILLICVLMAAMLSACSSKSEPLQEPDYAGTSVESALQSLSNGDYHTYESLLTEVSRSLLTEVAFRQVHQLVIDKIGSYINKTFIEAKEQGGYITFYYEATFAAEPSYVSVKAEFREDNGKMRLAGFWLDSPKLRN